MASEADVVEIEVVVAVVETANPEKVIGNALIQTAQTPTLLGETLVIDAENRNQAVVEIPLEMIDVVVGDATETEDVEEVAVSVVVTEVLVEDAVVDVVVHLEVVALEVDEAVVAVEAAAEDGTAEVWEVEEIEEVVAQSPINETHYISEAKVVEELCFCVSGVDV